MCVRRESDKDEYYSLPYQATMTGTVYGDYYHDLERTVNGVNGLPTSAASSLHLRYASSAALDGLFSLSPSSWV